MTTSVSGALRQAQQHVRIEGFLGPELAARLLAHVTEKESEFAPSRIGSANGSSEVPSYRVSQQLRDLTTLPPEIEARFLEVFESARVALQVQPFELHRLELDLIAHGDGAFYGQHIDTFTHPPDPSSDRVLTGVYYFHSVPKAFSGGELRLYPLPAKADSPGYDIAPDNDTLVLFVSWVPHEVRPVSCPSGRFADSRFAINCWYRRKREA